MNIDGFTPYLLGDASYHLRQWFMTSYRDGLGRANHRSILERLSNHNLSWGHSKLESAFGIFKHSFHKFLDTTDLYVTFVPDVVVYCCLLHKLLLGQELNEVAHLIKV
jgi:hypothetical protein